MSTPASLGDRSQRRGALDIRATTATQPITQSPFFPFALLLLYVAVVYLRPFEYRQYAETFRGVPLMPVLMGMMLLAWLAVPGKKFDAPQYGLMLGLLVCIPISMIAATRWMGGAVDQFVDFIPIAALFIVAASLLNSPRRLRQMFVVLGAVSAIMAWHGIDQIQNGIGWSGALPNQDRITYVGFLNDPNDLAMVFLIAIPMTLSFVRRDGSKLVAMIAIACTAAMLYGVYLTNSRGALIALAAMLIVYSLVRQGWKRSLFVVPVLLAALIFASPSRIQEISTEEESANARIEAWYEGLQLIREYPLFGVGKGQFLEHHGRTAHNSYILAAAEVGLIGYFFWFSLVALSAMMLFGLLRPPPEEPASVTSRSAVPDHPWDDYQRMARVLLYALTGGLTAAFFLSRTYIVPLFLMHAMILGLYQSAQLRWTHLPRFDLLSRFRQFALLEAGSLIFLWLTTRILLSTN